MRKILSLIICLLAVLSVCGCGNKTAKISPKKYDENFSADIPAADIIAAENERFVLKWDSQNERVVLLDKERDISWSYTPLKAQEKRVDADGNELNNHPQLESPILVTYYDPEQAVTDTAISSNASMRKRTYAVNSIENGLSIVFAFEKERISVTVDFILRNDSIAVTVDPNKITEDKNTVISVAVAPFFCSVQNKTEDSYLFFPSGSGALIYADYDSDDVNIISEEVFGTDARRPEDDVIKTITSNVRLPVYGAKDGERAVAAIIEKNAGAAVINANVGNATIGYSAVYATFYVRSYELVLTNNNSGQRMKYSEDIKSQLIGYLTTRMSLLHSAKVYIQYMNSPYIYGSNELSEIVGGARSDFDVWEEDYFRALCVEGREAGVFSDAVKPEAFSKLMSVLLKGIEMQFFHSGDYESMKSTYETMVELLVFKSTPPENAVSVQ